MVPPEQTQRWGLFPHGLQRHHPLPAAQAHRALPAGAAALRALRQHHHAGDGRQHPPGGGLGQPPARLQRLPAPPVRAGEPRHQGAAPRDPDRLLRAALLLRRVPGALHVVHPVFPDPLHLLHRLLHARGGAERDRERDRDAPGRPAPGGTQQPLLLVPGDRGPDLPPLPLHLLRHDGAGAAPAAPGAGAGQQRPLPPALLPPRPPPHRRLGGLALERSHPPEKIPRGDLRPRALGLLQPARGRPARVALRGGKTAGKGEKTDGETGVLVFVTQAKFLSQDQINEFKECFSLYDKRRKGKIQGSELLAVMRSLGVSPTPGEVHRHLQLHGIDGNAELDFSTFLTIMYRQMKQEEPEREILRALAMMDRHGRGVIAVPELRAKLTRLGEKLSEEEVDDLLKEARVGPNGTIKYEEFVRNICLPAVDY
ncbi:translation initiation factor IF-2 isoform X2 [Hirundo rustica]|uniref:translation initiation factor IF-2 isoform X2 n=1 Tax=Hirundo rustica TaxID=43150 RepID=UPI0026723C58|nr:translation initiation factor IF-2 isoform X2 [Hirundo rustica]